MLQRIRAKEAAAAAAAASTNLAVQANQNSVFEGAGNDVAVLIRRRVRQKRKLSDIEEVAFHSASYQAEIQWLTVG